LKLFPLTVTTKAMPEARHRTEGRKLKRKRVQTRKGCHAHIVLRSINDRKFEIIKFREGLIHPQCTPSRRQFFPSNKNVIFVHKDMICKYAQANIGLSKVYHLLKK